MVGARMMTAHEVNTIRDESEDFDGVAPEEDE
jgi:hypothetical protein